MMEKQQLCPKQILRKFITTETAVKNMQLFPRQSH